MKTYGNFSFAGIPGLRSKGRVLDYTPGYGWTYQDRFEGPPSSITSALNQASQDQHITLDQGQDGEDWKLLISTPDDPTLTTSQAAVTKFELVGNALQRDIREHPKALRLALVTDAASGTIMADIEKLLRQETVTKTEIEKLSYADAIALYKLMKHRGGSMAFQISQYVFRASTIIGKRSDFVVSYKNTNCLYTFQQLQDEANPTPDYKIALSVLEAQTKPATEAPGYKWKWLKQSPTITEVPGNRLGVTVEYYLEEWSTWTYADAVL